jgi:hypothetical protein
MENPKISIKGIGNLKKLIKKKEKKIVYDKSIDQISVDGQWEIPFHQEYNKTKNLIQLKSIFYDITIIKQFYEKIKDKKKIKYLNNIIDEFEKLIKTE